MNKQTTRGFAVTGAILAGLATLVGPAQATDQPAWQSERGNVIECHGRAHGISIRASVYENHRYGNTVQVVIGDPDAGNGASRDSDDKFVVDGAVKASVKIGGKRVLIEGAAKRHGARTKVYDERDDAGFHIITRGFHRQLVTDMGARYAGKGIPLTCETAFHFDLEVKKIPLT